ncbi:MAG: class I SAM-dependent methyltransferase [Actinomycetota bacterium]
MIHDAASSGYQRQSEAYATARPTYAAALMDDLVERLGAERWADLGAGTGLATAALVDRGVEVVAVEPVAAMRERFSEVLPHTPIVDGTASATGLADGSVEVVLVANAFHWFDHGPAMAELRRIIAPGGALVTTWNTRDDSIPWMAEYTRIGDACAGDTPRYKTMIWRRAIESDPAFELEFEDRVPNPIPTTADGVVARMMSTSFVGALDEAGRDEIEAEVRAAVADQGEVFDFAYVSEAQIWRRAG